MMCTAVPKALGRGLFVVLVLASVAACSGGSGAQRLVTGESAVPCNTLGGSPDCAAGFIPP